MPSSTPPVLPISTPPPPPPSLDPQPPPALRSFLATLTAQSRDAFAHTRPWPEFSDRSAFSRPVSLSDAASRLRHNYPYFRLNYLSLVAAVLALSLFSHPASFFILLALLFSWIFLYLLRPSDHPLILLGRPYSERETLGILVLLTIFVLLLTNVGSLLFSALLVGLAAVCIHGAFRIPEDLFLDEQEPINTNTNTGFFSVIGGAAKNVASAAPSVVASAR